MDSSVDTSINGSGSATIDAAAQPNPDAISPSLDADFSDTGGNNETRPNASIEDADTPPMDSSTPYDSGNPLDDSAAADDAADAGDAGDSDSGDTDADGSDGSTSFPVPADCVNQPLALACGGFESLDGWSSSSSGGSITQSTDQFVEGQYAIQAGTTTGSGWATYDTNFSIVSSGDIYFRSYFYLPSTVVIDDFNLFHFDSDPTSSIGFDINFEYFDPGSGPAECIELYAAEAGISYREYFSAGIPRDQWVCLQLEIFMDNADGTIDLYVDEVLEISEINQNTQPPDGLSHIAVGVPWTSATQTPLVIYLDAVVLDTSPIPCF